MTSRLLSRATAQRAADHGLGAVPSLSSGFTPREVFLRERSLRSRVVVPDRAHPSDTKSPIAPQPFGGPGAWSRSPRFGRKNSRGNRHSNDSSLN
jgi:hypothetical protein